ncbi:MAG: alanine racemase [Rikenellaceae bacterium]|nr:alanine racemase [Rikenellaceae bacterium]
MKCNLEHIASVCGARVTGDPEGRTVTGVVTDSRHSFAGSGSLFVAISGRNHDGHAYINELYRKGVRAFVIEKDVAVKGYPEAVFLRVESSVAALQALAADHRSRFGGLLAAVTGSNGKTVVKEWIAALAPGGVKLFRSPKSYNSQIGVPLSVLMMDGDEDVAVIEAGISHPGEMERLEAILKPDVGIITNIGDAHQENFRSLEEKAREKLSLFRGARTVIYSGTDRLVAGILESEPHGRRLVDAAALEADVAFLPDRASREDALLAAAFCREAGFPEGETRGKLHELGPVAMRLEAKEGIYGSVIIDDTYNSDINSLTIALDHHNLVSGGREQVLVLSDILQSGYGEAELYGRVAALVDGSNIAKLFAVGRGISRHSGLFTTPTEVFDSAADFLDRFDYNDIAGRAVLIKGNRGSRFERISHSLEQKSHTTTLEIDMDALVHNLNVHRAMLPAGTRVMAMVKASGYGHGNYELASLLSHHKVDYLAVAFADEGAELRRRGIDMPIVVLNADEGSYDLMAAHRLEPEIYSFRSLELFARLMRRHGERDYPVHIKLDTGMRRLGFCEDEVGELGQHLAALRGTVRVASVFSHLAAADVPAQDAFTRRQIELFGVMSETLARAVGYEPLRHISNSAATERFPEAALDMVRLGIGLYGVGAREGLGLRNVSTLRTRIVQVKTLRGEDTVGYGRAGQAVDGMRTATLPIGYADGLNRRLGEGNWSVMVGGKPCPTVGRICMDTCMIDVTGVDAAEGDEAVVFGSGPGNSVGDMASALSTIPYEIMTGISSRVKRIFTKE